MGGLVCVKGPSVWCGLHSRNIYRYLVIIEEKMAYLGMETISIWFFLFTDNYSSNLPFWHH